MTLVALDLVRERVKRFNIQCDLKNGFLGVAVNPAKGAALREWFYGMAKNSNYDTDAEWISPNDIQQWIDSPRYHSGYFDCRSGHLHPLNYCLGLAKGVASLGAKIFQNSAVQAMQQGKWIN